LREEPTVGDERLREEPTAMTAAAAREAFGAEFAGAEGFLNSPTYGLPPRFLVDALADCIGRWQGGTMDVPSFDEDVRAGREGYAALTGLPVGSVAMGATVSSALGLVAAAIPDGSRVATLPGEFTSTTFPFVAQAGRGVTVTELPADELVSVAAEFDVVTASLVQSANGAVLDMDTLRRNVEGTDTLTVIDVTQALGWKRVDLGWVDVTAAAVYKWLLAPRGTAWMSLSDRVSRIMTPHAANWYAGEQPWQSIYGLPLRLAGDARRFDLSPAWFSALGAGLTLPWLVSLDAGAVQEHTVGLADRLRAELRLPQQDSAIVSIPIDGAADKLARAGIRASVRAGAVRVGFHLYNNDNDLDRLLDALNFGSGEAISRVPS
jgi:selenocysteine lyase/cysteine desulfurase